MIEEYEDVKSNALIAYNASNAVNVTMEKQKQKARSQSLQITHQLELEIKKN